MAQINEHRAVQAAAKNVLVQLQATLSPLDSERKIAIRAKRMLAACGITQTWYYNCPALVLAGPRTCLSLSGKDYDPSDDEIGSTNLVTVDLSPSVDGVWGDCARSFFVEDGVAVGHPQNAEFISGRKALSVLHANLLTFAAPDTTFEDLCEYASSQIKLLGFVNLDFRGNVGHTIESDPAMRNYIEAGNTRPLSCARLFTFEPHIKALKGSWGFKHEEIYHFYDHQLRVL
jgi:hypothetical protein